MIYGKMMGHYQEPPEPSTWAVLFACLVCAGIFTLMVPVLVARAVWGWGR